MNSVKKIRYDSKQNYSMRPNGVQGGGGGGYNTTSGTPSTAAANNNGAAVRNNKPKARYTTVGPGANANVAPSNNNVHNGGGGGGTNGYSSSDLRQSQLPDTRTLPPPASQSMQTSVSQATIPKNNSALPISSELCKHSYNESGIQSGKLFSYFSG
jgi:hypothetical protein